MLDTDTKKTNSSSARFEVERLLDLYWGGSERRITGLTLKILAVNVIALLLLAVGVLYLGQYHNNIIEARMQTFEREIDLVSVVLGESDFRHIERDGGDQRAEYIIDALNLDSDKQLYVFDRHGSLIARTEGSYYMNGSERSRYQSFEVLKELLRFVLFLLPDKQKFPKYSYPKSLDARDYPGVLQSLAGFYDLQAWESSEERLFLSASVPLRRDGEIWGALFLTWDGGAIEEDVNEVWVTLLSVFFCTLVLTIFLSIYLSGAIARPLKKLARAAENVRKGQARADDIPDFSDRFDEIGELSLVLRDMTMSLSEKMDSIERFAADVSHELKNPLTSLRSAVETFSVVKSKKDKDKLMAIIGHDIERMDRLITDISRASRLETLLSRQSLDVVDLRSVLHKVLRAYGAVLDRDDGAEEWFYEVQCKGIAVRMDSSHKDALYVRGVEGQLMQVFENILSNALSFSSQGGEVDIRVALKKKQVLISIENDGPHIPKGKEIDIFERFYSERPEHEDYGQNSGLGLSIVKQIVEAHSGSVSAENLFYLDWQAKGVRFNVYLNKA